MKKFALAGLALLMFPVFSVSQILEPVKWSFHVHQTRPDEATLLMIAKIDQGWHLYSISIPPGGPLPTVFTFDKNKNYTTIGDISEPSGEEEYDPNFEMKLKFFDGTAVFKQPIKVLTATPFSIKGTLSFMCCDDKRCLPPADVDFTFNLPGKAIAAADIKSTEPTTPSSAHKDTQTGIIAKPVLHTDSLNIGINATSTAEPETKGESLWVFFIIALLAGFAGALTPCVYPMIPMTVSFFMRSSKSKFLARTNAIFYGISIIFIYTVIGVLVSVLFGSDAIKNISSHWITNIIFFLLFAAFAASFFGMFEIVLPSSLTNKSDKQVDKGGLIGTFFMALTLVLVSFSCTAPFIGGILVEASTGSILKPIIGMFGFSLTFALPFTILAFFPSWLGKLPKSGGWLNSVKVVLGFIILALGMKFLLVPNDVLGLGMTREFVIAVWIVLFSLLGFYLLGKIKFAHDSEVAHIGVPRLLLVILSFTFVVYLIPGMFGAPLKIVSGFLPAESSFNLIDIISQNRGTSAAVAQPANICDPPKYSDIFKLSNGLQGYFEYNQGLSCAKKLNKPVFLDFTGRGCVNCKMMERNVFTDPQVLNLLSREFIIIALYADDRTELPESEWITSRRDGKVKKTIGQKNLEIEISRFNVNAQPYYALIDTSGNLLTAPRAYNLDVDAFVAWLDGGLKQFQQNQQIRQ
jgi:thiol:disulfide interchange protein DsbD